MWIMVNNNLKMWTLMNKITILVLITLTSPAMAYIDPGSGSAIMSAIIAAFVAVGLAIKTFWYKIKGFLGLSKKTEINPSETDEDE